MITESDARSYNGRTRLVWSLCASLLVNFLAWSLVLWLAGLHLVRQHEKPEFVVSSSSVRIEKRIQPQPPRRQVVTLPQRQPQPKQSQPKRQVSVQRPIVHEPAKTLAQQLAQQEQTFEKTAQKFKEERQIESTATAAPIAPSTYRRTYVDLNGRSPREKIDTILDPLPGPHMHWYENGMSCYYVHYYAQYSGGGNEQGNIPWPVCYPADHDAMLPLDRQHDLPVPAPQPGWPLPPGTALGPLLQDIYSGIVHR